MRKVFALFLIITATSCGQSKENLNDSSSNFPTSTARNEGLTPAGLYPILSETGLYQDMANKTVSADNLPYSPQYPLFSDGARKRRWIYLPPGSKIDTHDLDHWIFPAGTKFWKEFQYPDLKNPNQFRRVETRFLEKLPNGGWIGGTYLWNDGETEGTLNSTGILNYYPLKNGAVHNIPSAAECRYCHSRGGDRVLGFDFLQLSDDRDPLAPHADMITRSFLTLSRLKNRGALDGFPNDPGATSPRIQSLNPLGRATMGYMHGNCSSCHNPLGTMSALKLSLRHVSSARSEREEPAYATTIGKLTDQFQIPNQNPTFLIYPGAVEKSAIFHLCNLNGTLAMPPDRATIDQDFVNLLRSWIESL